MINNEELQISNKTYINKDFQTIYPELVSLVKTLTNRWNPEETNESDPLLVLLKLLAFMGDKNNYNIDKNILEAFLPSATQETSVNQLLEMNGYAKKYYQSASTIISVLYAGDINENKSILLKAFETQFTDTNNSVTYTLLQDINLLNTQVTYTGLITEGTPKDLSINGNTTIQLSNLDENYRLYFPETMVAQNRIYVKNEGSNDWNTSGNSGDGWSQVNNLNLYSPKSKNFKFGFDSNKNLPYIQFPDDIIELIGNGLNVKYIVTIGDGGNISRGKINAMSNPTSDTLYYYNGYEFTEDLVILTDEINNQNLLKVFNYYASTNGADPETIDEAYNNFKKTIGTFNTLVTPRDFAHWLYNYVDSETTYPIISNIQVGDRRIDTNFYQPVITYNDYGVTTDYVYVHQKSNENLRITPFDLTLYPLKRVNTFTLYDQNGNIKQDNYDETFLPDIANISTLINVLQDTQSIDHTFIQVDDSNNEPYLYKCMYTLNIKVSTLDKVNEVERRIIINNIKQALFENFNSRELDYGYEIPVDEIYKVVLNSDARIKNVFLDDPILTTKAITKGGIVIDSDTLYINMIAKNVLAGKVNLYDYLDNFDFNYSMNNPTLIENVVEITPTLTLTTPTDYQLKTNQVVQVFSDNFSTSTTATVGVNYYWDANHNLDANKPYKIDGGEALFLSYTNSDNVLKTFKYEKNSITTYDKNGIVLNVKSVNNNIIEPTFILTPTGDYGTIDVPGMSIGKFNQLGSNEEIKFLSKNELTFDKNTYYFYWKVSNSSNTLFEQDQDDIILGEDEYFMYTDSSKSNVEIFSSGTRISKVGLDNVTWECPQIDSSELVDGDLSTYVGIEWVPISFDDNGTLTIAQQTILTLTEGDIVDSNMTLTSELTGLVSEDFINYKFSGDEYYTPISYDDLHNYRVRTRLDIVCGPNLPQTVGANETITYKVNGGSTTSLTGTFVSNYLIQRSGNGTIDTKLEGTNFNLIKYTKVDDPSQIDRNVVKQGNQYKIEFKKLEGWVGGNKEITINIPQITNKTSKFMLYFSKDTNITDSVELEYGGSTLTINSGVNMVEIPTSSLTISISSSSPSSSKSYLILDEVKIINDINSIFDLTTLQKTALRNKINDILNNTDVKFYETYTIPYANMIDTEEFKKSETLWDKNNVVNKFTLAQIDFDASRFDILKSSLK